MTTGTAPSSPLAQLDEAKPNRFQMKIMLVSGMGFFTDAYDLFVIGVVVAILKTQWHLTTTQVSLLSSTTLAASAVGAILFGRIADILGRKRMYGYEVLILAGGAIASAFAPSIAWLVVFRIILGIGIGGDYPVSATIMSEYAGKRSRGQMIGLVFAMQAAGLIVGPLIAVLLLAAGVSHDLTWRLLLGLGAIPGLAVYYLRRQIHETPRFALAGGDLAEAEAAIAEATGHDHVPAPAGESSARQRQPLLGGLAVLLTTPKLLRWIVGASAAWFMMDFAYYGNTIASPAIIKLLSPHASLEHSTLITLLIFVLAAAPGYFVAIALIDRIGRKSIQSLGFFVMALMFGLIALIPSASTTASTFVILFGISYFFTEFGPNTTTFVYPAEIFPVQLRTSGHGIAAATGKMGAFVGTFLFPQMLASWGIRGAEGVAAGVALIGLVFTLSLLPEPKGRSLEELTAEALERPVPPTLVPAQA
ncbi:MAG TPA: MFS transporter [Solirubrobacteraceae bacterium]|nr:MFS transporter [Solirubrobacteraceae bacterium]